MNFVGQAQALTEEHIARSLRNRTRRIMPFSGACLSCEEPVQGKRRFCDSEGRIDWETDWGNERKRKFVAIR